MVEATGLGTKERWCHDPNGKAVPYGGKPSFRAVSPSQHGRFIAVLLLQKSVLSSAPNQEAKVSPQKSGVGLLMGGQDKPSSSIAALS